MNGTHMGDDAVRFATSKLLTDPTSIDLKHAYGRTKFSDLINMLSLFLTKIYPELRNTDFNYTFTRAPRSKQNQQYQKGEIDIPLSAFDRGRLVLFPSVQDPHSKSKFLSVIEGVETAKINEGNTSLLLTSDLQTGTLNV